VILQVGKILHACMPDIRVSANVVTGKQEARTAAIEESSMVTTRHLRLDRVTRAPLADAVYETIMEGILGGHYASGAELTEVALAAELGVSRTPVHEALKRLALDGLVEPMTNRQSRVVLLTAPQVREIYEMRMLLEPAAAERAAERLDPAHLDALRASAQGLAASTSRPNWALHAIEFDIRFHDTLAAACGNERLRAEIIKYRRMVRAFCRATGSADNLRQAFAEHLEILTALEKGDGVAAHWAMTNHISARMRAALAEVGGREVNEHQLNEERHIISTPASSRGS
jgi:DNA-binding GntR family transcriptional regulator